MCGKNEGRIAHAAKIKKNKKKPGGRQRVKIINAPRNPASGAPRNPAPGLGEKKIKKIKKIKDPRVGLFCLVL